MPRKEKKFHFIYKTTNTKTGRYYIGMHSTDNLEDGYLGSGRRLRRSVKKHGADCHKREILEFCNSRKELVAKEKEVITLEEVAKNDCMNLMPGGRGGFISDEQQLQRSMAGVEARLKKLEDDPEYKANVQKVGRKNILQAHKDGRVKYDTFTGRNHSEDTKKKMSETRKGTGVGKSNSQFGTCWVNKDGVVKKVRKEDFPTMELYGWKRGRKH